MPTAPVIYWFRQDLRLADNRALAAAVATGVAVIPVFVLDDAAAEGWPLGSASRWWLHGSLLSLTASLEQRGSGLILRRGHTIETLLRVATEAGARAIYCTRAYEPFAARLEIELKAACDEVGIELRRFAGGLLHEPETIKTKTGAPFRVFTPFWRAVIDTKPPSRPLGPPLRLLSAPLWPAGDRLDEWRLLPQKPDWAGGMRAMWRPGEVGAAERLATLLDVGLRGYAGDRDRPDIAGTSMLSPHLHFGEISPSQCWHAVEMARERNAAVSTGAETFLREIGWREFSYHLLHHWPDMVETAFRPEFAAFPWDGDTARTARNFDAWSRGQTGYPIVDAGMRQLWQTGWMHNRVRMIAASFLTKHLLIPWQSGAAWFWDTLVDADLASNSASWQWVAGSGADAAPYFRIFNPILQGQKFDPDGAYVRQYLPELARLPIPYLNAPWTAPKAELARAGVVLGKTYPMPIVDHAAARARALAAYGALRAIRDNRADVSSGE